MTGKPVVFLGPTMPRRDAAAILDAVYLPPAEQGSIVQAMRTHEPTAIILIDGAFGKVPAVRHKEILWALAIGVPVFGAASMGALRAAELGPFGMRGYGFISRWYALTPLADDDEVAVAMCPPELGSAALSEALINMRVTLRQAQRVGIIGAVERRALEAHARSIYFVDRSYPQLLSEARSVLPPTSLPALTRLAEWLPASAIDRKRQDAVGLFEDLARSPRILERLSMTPDFRLTEAWAYDLEAAGLWGDDIAPVLAAQDEI